MTRSILSTATLLAFAFSAMAQVSVTTKLPSTVVPGSEFNVELNISKGDIGGFAKLQHELPTGFTATAGETANSTFSFKDRKVKFLWMALPGTSDISVSYKVKVDAGVSGSQILEGTFSYIRNNETEKFVIPKDIIMVGADQAAAAQAAATQNIIEEEKRKAEAAEEARKAAAESESSVSETADAAEPSESASSSASDKAAADKAAADKAAADKAAADKAAADKAAADKAAADKAAAEAKKKEDQNKAAQAQQSQPSSSGSTESAMLKSVPGLVFRVQVAAGPNKVDPSFFANKYGISDAISVEEHEGLYKYVVGEFGSYRPAKTFSNELRDNNSVDGPFVTAYNNGVRIHVKEALDIAGQ